MATHVAAAVGRAVPAVRRVDPFRERRRPHRQRGDARRSAVRPRPPAARATSSATAAASSPSSPSASPSTERARPRPRPRLQSGMALLGLRHVALNVRDPQASKRFYADCFGMSVVWEPDPDNVYMSSGPDNLALHRVVRGGAGRARPPRLHRGHPRGRGPPGRALRRPRRDHRRRGEGPPRRQPVVLLPGSRRHPHPGPFRAHPLEQTITRTIGAGRHIEGTGGESARAKRARLRSGQGWRRAAQERGRRATPPRREAAAAAARPRRPARTAAEPRQPRAAKAAQTPPRKGPRNTARQDAAAGRKPQGGCAARRTREEAAGPEDGRDGRNEEAARNAGGAQTAGPASKRPRG